MSYRNRCDVRRMRTRRVALVMRVYRLFGLDVPRRWARRDVRFADAVKQGRIREKQAWANALAAFGSSYMQNAGAIEGTRIGLTIPKSGRWGVV